MRLIIAMIVLALAPGLAYADQVIPADQDSLASAQASPQVQDSSDDAQPANAAAVNKPTSNFGSAVSQEAQSFKETEQEQGENFGSWVSEQREHSENHEHDREDQDTDDAVSGSTGSGSSTSPSGTESWPGLTGTGGTTSSGTTTVSSPNQISHGGSHGHDD